MKVLFLFMLMIHSGNSAERSKPVDVSVERVGAMTHIEFSGHQEWDYDIRQDGDKIKLQVPKLSEKAKETLGQLKSLLIEKVEFDDSIENKSKMIIHLHDKAIEGFDYLTQKPSRLILDLFVEDDSLVQKLQKKKEERLAKSQEKPKEKKTVKKAQPESERQPASEFISVDNSDPALFNQKLTDKPPEKLEDLFEFGALGGAITDASMEASVIEAKGNIYLRFPPLRLENNHLKELQSFRPQYEIKKSFSDENKQARSLLALFEQKSYAAFIKGKRIFKKDFPKSSYDEILSYVEADTWIELWRMNKRPEYLTKALNLYKLLIERYPNAPLAERTLIFTGLLAHDVEEYFIATKMLKRYIRNHDQSPFVNYVRIYLADSLAQLKNYDGATQLLNQVIKSGEINTMIEAKYRLGDIYFQKESFRRSEQAYLEAIKDHPKSLEAHPNAIFNLAEAQFNLAEYQNSLDSYRKFHEMFPTHAYGGLALTRVGELIDILYSDKHWAQGFYNESYFKFRDTVGGAVARMRSLSQRFKDMRTKELQYAEEEILRLKKQVNLPEVDEFAAFMISDGFFSRGDYSKAAGALIGYFQKNPQPVNIKKFEKRVSNAIAKQVEQKITEGDVVAALELIEEHQNSWLSKAQRTDIQFSRAFIFEKMGLFDKAIQAYQRLQDRLDNLAGTREEAERRIFERYPTKDQVRVRLAHTHYLDGDHKQTVEMLKKVKKISDLNSDEKLDYYITLSRLSFDNKKYADALKTMQLIDMKIVDTPEKTQKYKMYMSQVHEKNQQYDQALDLLDQHYKTTSEEDDKPYILSRIFSVLRAKQDVPKAIEVGENLIKKYGKEINIEKERYYLGELYFKADKLDKAQQAWDQINKDSVWAELARNKSTSQEWKEKTDASLNRLPAMQR